jgi:hypothetical protein
MNVIASHMCVPETPVAVYADFPENIEDGRSAVPVQDIGRLVHLVTHHGWALWIRFDQSATRNTVTPVH